MLNRKKDGFKRIGYSVAIIVNVILLYLINNLPNWNVHFLSNSFTDCLWAINLSLTATIVGNVLFLIYDERWFKLNIQIILNIFAIFAAYTIYRIFPFNLTNKFWIQFIEFFLILFILANVIGIISNFFKLIIPFIREHKI